MIFKSSQKISKGESEGSCTPKNHGSSVREIDHIHMMANPENDYITGDHNIYPVTLDKAYKLLLNCQNDKERYENRLFLYNGVCSMRRTALERGGCDSFQAS